MNARYYSQEPKWMRQSLLYGLERAHFTIASCPQMNPDDQNSPPLSKPLLFNKFSEPLFYFQRLVGLTEWDLFPILN